jgi:hypothetical protein
LVVNLEKREFWPSQKIFWAITFPAAGAKHLLQHVVKEFQQPVHSKGLQSLLGEVNFSGRFIPGVANIRIPLISTVCGGKWVKLSWSLETASAFDRRQSSSVSRLPGSGQLSSG